MVIPLPTKTCLLIERLMRNFLWSVDRIKSKSNYVRWETVCLPKSKGGLGLRRLKELNEACPLKLGWSAVTGNGKSINLWHDNWIDNDPISSKFNQFQFSENDLVSYLISEVEWRIPSQLSGSLQEFLSQATNLIPLGLPPVPDSLFWKNSSGKFSLQEAWNLLRTPDSIKTWSSLILNNLVNPWLACHSWRLMHRRTPTEIWAKSKGWSMASRCHNCFIEEESDLHLFFSCSLAQKFWAWLLSPYEVRLLYPISASSIWNSVAKKADVLGRKCAATIFFHAIFIPWQLRNDSKHNSRLPNLERAKVHFLDLLKSIVNFATGQSFVFPCHPILTFFIILS
ncbi:hypothetical protein AAC387_Pa12g0445 [Persea americana]